MLLPITDNIQPRHGISKVVPSIGRSVPALVKAMADFKESHFPNAKFEVYESSVSMTGKATVITLRRSRDDMELVVDRRLRSGSWKSESVRGIDNILQKLSSKEL